MSGGVLPGVVDGVSRHVDAVERRVARIEERIAEWMVKLPTIEGNIDTHHKSLRQGALQFVSLLGLDGKGLTDGTIHELRTSIAALRDEIDKLRKELAKQGRRQGIAAVLGTAIGAGVSEVRRILGGH